MINKNIETMTEKELLESFIIINNQRKEMEKYEEALKKKIMEVKGESTFPFISETLQKRVVIVQTPTYKQYVEKIKTEFTVFKKRHKLSFSFFDLITVNKSKFKSLCPDKEIIKKFDLLLDDNSELLNYTECLKVYDVK